MSVSRSRCGGEADGGDGDILVVVVVVVVKQCLMAVCTKWNIMVKW